MRKSARVGSPLDLPLKVWGRPVKPVALGFCVLMGTLAVYNIRGIGLLGDTAWSHAVGVLAGTSALMMLVGWIGKRQALAKYGLFAAAITYLIRLFYLLLTEGITNQSFWLSLGAAIIASGSFFLEDIDPKRENEL